MNLSPGTTLGHYTITASLGSGGMGEVYRATDTRLGRDIAIKLLPPSMAADADRIERFRREARAVAALNHPAIVTLYSVEFADGLHFLTMELCEGESLDRLVGGAGLPTLRILEIGIAVADALDAAHGKGIIHRDLKPANVIVGESRRVKVLDFGLAKFAGEVAATTGDAATMMRTGDGIVMGTAPYMSPEQIEGRPVDHRSDLFSLGVMLHELTTGVRPFQGTTTAAVAASILRDQPAPVTIVRPDVPRELAAIIACCLEKDPARRIGSAAQVRDHLESIRRGLDTSVVRRSGPSAVVRPVVAVLPFANLSPDPDNEYFSDGLTEEIIADLAKVKALSVISRTSSMQLKGAKKDIRTIGQELGARYVLEGSVRKAGSSLRITAQLVDASTDAQLWSEKYGGTVDDVFEVQERVSREIVKALDITLSTDEQERLSERAIVNPRAFELYLRARQELRRMDGSAAERATALVREAIRIEGETPALLTLLTQAKVITVRVGVSRDYSPLDEAEREAKTLLQRVPDAPYGHALLAQVAYERGRHPEVVHHCTLALEREPNDSDILFYMGISYSAAGQNAQAIDVGHRILAMDPLGPLAQAFAGISVWFVGRVPESIGYFYKALELDPQNFIVHWSTGYACATAGRLADAARHARILNDAGPDLPYTRQLLALIDAIEGRPEVALQRLTSVDPTALDAHHRFHLAESYAMAGAIEPALDLLEQSIPGFYPYEFLERYCRFIDPLRGHPRFESALLLAKRLAADFQRQLNALHSA